MRIDRLTAVSGSAWTIELRFTPSGRAVCTVHIMDGTESIRAEAWDQIAEQIAELPENVQIRVSGYWKDRKWEDREGTEHSIKFLAIRSWERL